MAEKRTIDINIKNNADEAAKDFNTFNDALDETAKSAKNVNSTFEEVYGDLQPLTTRLGEAEDRLYELALAGDTTSKEYQELLTKVGEYRKVQIQTDLAVDGAATTMTQKLGSALNAATSGFAATQGAIALFGEENEALNESLLKVQSALAIQQGVQGLTDAYKELSIGTKLAGAAQAIFSTVVGTTSGALKVFRIALISTGIGAIVVALGLLIANFDKVSNFVRKAVDGFDKLGGVMKIILLPITAVIEAFKLVQQGLQAIGVIESEEDKAKEARYQAEMQRIEQEVEARKRAFDARQKQFDREIALLEAEGKSSFELRQQKIRDSIAVQKQEIEAYKTTLRIFENSPLAELAADVIKEYEEQVETLYESIKDQENQLTINVINNNKKKADSYRSYLDERKSIARQIEDLENDLLKDGLEKELEINRDKFRRLREDVKGNAEEQAILRALYLEQEAKAEAEIRNKFRKESLQEEIDFFTENKLPVLQAQADEEVEVEINKWSLIGQVQKKAFDDEKERRQKIQDFAINSALDGLQTISDITELFGKKGEKQARRAFQVQKAANIAQAVISTYQGANAIFASAAANPKSVLFPAQPFIAAGLAIASGLANVAKISSQKFEGGSVGGGGDTGAPDLTGGETVAPSFNVVGDSSVNQLAQLQQTPTQAYVVSGEVTSAQALDRNRVTNATL